MTYQKEIMEKSVKDKERILKGLREQGISYLNLDSLKTGAGFEAKNPEFLIVPNYDYEADGKLHGYYVMPECMCGDVGSWRKEPDTHGGFTIDLDGEDYGSLQSFLDTCE